MLLNKKKNYIEFRFVFDNLLTDELIKVTVVKRFVKILILLITDVNVIFRVL